MYILTAWHSVLRRQFYVRRIFYISTFEQELVLGQFILCQLQRSNVPKVFVHLITEEKASNHRDTHTDAHGASVPLIVQPLLPLSPLEVWIHRRRILLARSSTTVAILAHAENYRLLEFVDSFVNGRLNFPSNRLL